MKKIFVFIFLTLSLTATSQEFNNLKKIVNISIDPFKNIFLCEKRKIIKIEKQSNKRLEYDFSKYGYLTKIITTNPLRTTLFFEESQTIIFLDKNLNKLNMELKIQNIQNIIISDIETHSNLIFLLSKKSNELCIYDFKKSQIVNCNSNLGISKNEYLKIFLNKDKVVLLNNEEVLILDENLIPDKIKKIENCERLFFNNDSVYLNIKNKLYKSSIIDMENLFFVKQIAENNLLYIENNILFGLKNNFFWEEKLRQ